MKINKELDNYIISPEELEMSEEQLEESRNFVLKVIKEHKDEIKKMIS